MEMSEFTTKTWQTALGVAVSASIALTGCTDAMDDGAETTDNNAQTQSETTDVDRDGSFLDMADQKDMTADDPRTRGILELANTASQQKLDSSDEVGLDVRAARNIVDTRQSDGSFETLEELDEVPWVSDRAFGKMYEYAMNNGYVDGQDGSGDDSSSDDGSSDDLPETLYGVDLGSDEADAILAVANEESEQTLDSSEEVGLDARAASNIVAERPFANLAELDEVAWVSERAFGKLSEYATSNGYVDQQDDSTDDGSTEMLYGIALGGDEADDILKVANEESERTLASSEKAGLDDRAASNIVDQRPFDDLHELDEVGYVAEIAFVKLLRWANRYRADSPAEIPSDEMPSANRVTRDLSDVHLEGIAARQLQRTLDTLPDDHDRGGIDCGTDSGSGVFSCTIHAGSAGTFEEEHLVTFSGHAGTDTLYDAHLRTDAEVLERFDCSRSSSISPYGSFTTTTCHIDRVPTVAVKASGDTLPALGDEYVWEGWMITPDGPKSTGHFEREAGKDVYGFGVAPEVVRRATKFVLTIEPADEPEGTPSAQKYLGGYLVGDRARITTTFGPTLDGASLEDTSGEFFLAAPSGRNNSATDYRNGIWFIDNSGSGKAAGLDLPELDNGWTYEGWVVGEDGPISTGRFDSPSEADSDRGGPFAGAAGTPPFPGQDFVLSDGRRDLTAGYKAVITVEPKPDNSPKPFAPKPLAGSIEDAGKGTLQQLDDKQLPEATVTVE